MSEEQMRDKVLAYIKREYIEDEDEAEDLEADTPLIESGLIDSFSITSIRDWLERTFEIKIPDEQGTVDNFASVNAIISLVQARRQG